ncbi:MAG: valine--tRNA ligase [Lachnospiraceae bacterium]|nr:valine--tRNA ligase [Lachnospiraceae bacterium]
MLSKKYNAAESEAKWQEFWQEKGIYKFSSESEQPVYSIDTPPPTVNGRIHIGHIFSYSQAEVMARYKRMKGFNVFYPFGFDDNGLPTERLVESTHGIKAHETTREHFTELCLGETRELEKQFKKLFISAGFSCDWEHEYSTISPKAQKTSQKSFIDLYRKKKVYFSEAPALWCPECQTAIAQAELETKEIPSLFNYLKFFIDGEDDKYVEIATTRPELIAACQCIFIHPEDEKNRYLLGKQIKVPLFGFTVPVLEDEKVEREKGSGVVMCCTFGDLTDLEWYKKHNLTFKEAILQDGTMSEICGKYAGMKILDARKAMIADLIEQGHMIRQEQIAHNVATHERCGTPMEITIKKQWFIDILSNKEEYLRAGDKINWYPAHMQARYTNWVENLEWDWCISRQRYFGVPFPVWYCKSCGSIAVPEIEDLPVNPLKDRPKKPCSCGCTDFEPEKDIMDTWATSSVTPLINLEWHDDEKFRKDMAPMSLRPNAHDIIRTWDFYTIVKSLYHTGKIPWEDVMISGHVMASKGEKISKRKGNSSMEPAELISEYSADAVRLWTSSGSLGNDIVFSEEEFKNANKLINKIWNAAKFVIMQLEGFEKTDEDGNRVILNAFDKNEKIDLWTMDKWVIYSFNNMLARFEKYLEKYEIGLAIGELEKFFWSYCDDYIEIIKNRVYKPEIFGENARKSGLYASYHTLLGMLKCFAIYIPHITEEIYQGYFASHEEPISIHKALIGPVNACADISEEDYKTGEMAVDIISEFRKYKSERNLSLKDTIDSALIRLDTDIELKDALEDIKAVCACRDISISRGETFGVEFMVSK